MYPYPNYTLPVLKRKILTLVATKPGIDYYQLLRELNCNSYDLANCLSRLVLLGNLVKIRDTPNPTFKLLNVD